MTQQKWNWQRSEWPSFSYDKEVLAQMECQFLQNGGALRGTIKHIHGGEKERFIIQLMSDEALKTSGIEGEYLNRESIQDSIRKTLGLEASKRNIPPAEYGIAELCVDLYQHYDAPLTHEKLFSWHRMMTNGRRDLNDIGCYRTHDDPMQIVSGYAGKQKVHFEAPPSQEVFTQMTAFLDWFNANPAPNQPLARAGIAHFYFINIHPFEDGNGRIGRAISQKAIAQSLGQPALLSLSHTIYQNKKAYYQALESHNRRCELTDWLRYFAQTILDAQTHTLKTLDFIIEKAKLFDQHGNSLNDRQQKVIRRLFDAGYTGFMGGLSAQNYISITQTSPATARRDLGQLVGAQILRRTGERKATRYWLNIKTI